MSGSRPRSMKCIMLMCLILSGTALSLIPDVMGNPGSEDVALNGLDDQKYTAKVDIDEKAHFIWVLENNNATLSYDVDITVLTTSDLWETGTDMESFTLRPGATRLIDVWATSSKGDDGDSDTVNLNITLVEIGTGNTSFKSASASVKLHYESKAGVDILFWHMDLPSTLDNPWGRFILLVIIWSVLVVVFVVGIIDGLLRRMVRGTKTKADDIVLDIIRKPIIFLSIAYGIINTLGVLEVPRIWIIEIETWFTVISMVIVAYIAYKIIKDVLLYYGDMHVKRTGNETAKMITPLLNNLVSVVIVVVAGSFILSYLGYDITVAVAGLGIMGLVIAFAAQDTLSNFFSGLHMLIDRPFQKGDLIILETGELCEIRSIGFRTVRLYDVMKHVLITMPNNSLANAKISNFSAPDYHFRLKLPVSVAYGTDIKLVNETLGKVVRGYPDILKKGRFKPSIRFRQFGDSHLAFNLYVWIEDVKTENYLIMNRIRSDLNERIYDAFNELGIKIPFPQREVWVSSMPKGE